MTKIWILAVICLGISAADANDKQRPEVGYLNLENTQIPELVRQKHTSVFRFVELAHSEFSEKLSKEARDDLLKSRCSSKEHFLIALQCQALSGPANHGKEWFIPYLSTGTAFFAENRRTLWTVWHNLYNQNQTLLLFVSRALVKWPMKKRQSSMRKIVPEFLLFDPAGKLVFDSRASQSKPKFLSNGDPAASQVYEHDLIFTTALDFARIEMPRDFQRPPLSLATGESTDNEVFLLGFPGPSMSASPGRVRSNGYDLYANLGSELALSEIFPRVKLPDNEMNAAIKHKLAPALQGMNLDVQPGFSGGPILNRKGELIGILTGRLENPEKEVVGALGVRASWVEAFSRDPDAALEAIKTR